MDECVHVSLLIQKICLISYFEVFRNRLHLLVTVFDINYDFFFVIHHLLLLLFRHYRPGGQMAILYCTLTLKERGVTHM